MIKNKAQKPHYVDNKKFLEAMVEYREKLQKKIKVSQMLRIILVSVF